MQWIDVSASHESKLDFSISHLCQLPPWSPKEAQWTPQWSLNGRYWSAKGGVRVAQGRQKHRSDWCACLLWATCEWPTSLATFVRLFWICSKLHGDQGVHGEVWTSFVPPLNDQGSLSASFVPSTATWPVFGRTREAQRSQPLCKGGYKGALVCFVVTVHWWRLRTCYDVTEAYLARLYILSAHLSKGQHARTWEESQKNVQ